MAAYHQGVLKAHFSMRVRIKKALVLPLLGSLLACATATAPNQQEEIHKLLQLHEDVLRAHRESNIDLLLAAEEDEYVIANRGAVTNPNREARRMRLGSYLKQTRFSVYRDQVPAIARVSRDGSLGWVIAQVEGRGEQTKADGTVEALEFVSAWIELYEKRDGRWLRVGNVSNFKPQ